jgi:iron complex outermembrane receptor protein
MNNRTLLTGLFLTTALGSSLPAAYAFAQAPAAAGGQVDVLSDVVVTATKQSDTVNRVALSISAATQKSLDQQGVKTVQDLGRTVPALQIAGNNNSMTPTLTIRGIYANTGAATTGVYLDDTPLTKRQVSGSGGNTNGNGTPVPPLFDLERVEVLRGPQGTLYGGSSEGGTVRFITPTPSLTTMSGNVRVEASSTHDGAPSYETGIAVGGPIIQDKLGIRLSGFFRNQGGYIDHVDIFHGDAVFRTNTNTERTGSARAVLLWAPTEDLRVTLAGFVARDVQRDANTAYSPVTGVTTTPQLCFNTTRVFGGAPPPTAATPCPANAVPGQTVGGIYARPAASYGPYPLASYQSIYSFLQPSQTSLEVASLTLDYDLKAFEVKSITSVLHDSTKAYTYDTSQVGNFQTGGFGSNTGLQILGLLPQFPPQGPIGYFGPTNARRGITEEVRISSPGDARPISWVAGVYYSRIKGQQGYDNVENLDVLTQAEFGITTAQRYGNPLLYNGSAAFRYQSLVDTEKAVFGEANLYLTRQLKVTGGLRYSSEEFSFYQAFYGPLSGFNVPTTANGGLTNGSQKESPLTPKVGVSYNFTDNDMVYATAAKGFRPGGVNGPLSPFLCIGLAAQGLTPADLPSTFASDSVWSYEAGTKLRVLDNRVQLNASAYHIKWTGVQLQVSTSGCGQTYVLNAGAAQSDGFDLQASARIFKGLTGTLAVGYNKARYTADAFGPAPKNGTAATKVVNQDDTFPVSPWTATLGLQYQWEAGPGLDAYVRGDYQYASNYHRSLGAGPNGYAPDSRNAHETTVVNARVGISKNGWDINLFAKNLFEEKAWVTYGGGRTGCSAATGAACSTFTGYNPEFSGATLRPREIGIQASMRY